MQLLNNALFPPPLTRKESDEMVQRTMKGDSNARDILIERNMRFVAHIAKKFDNIGISFDERISVGAIGLIKAVNSFDPDKNIKLATYAARCIENEILMAIRKANQPTRNGIQVIPLEKVTFRNKDGNELLLLDTLGTEPDPVSKDLEAEAERQTLHCAINKLNAKEKSIIEMRFGLGTDKEHTQGEIADMIGVSQSYISRLEKRIIGKLRKVLAEGSEAV